MSLFSSLDALEAATDAPSAPRAALFQPKVKPRARKVGGGGDTRSAIAKPPSRPSPSEKASPAATDPPLISTTESDVTRASATPARSLELQNPRTTTTQNVLGIEDDTGKRSSALEDGAPLTANDTYFASPQNNAVTIQAEAAPDVSIAQPDNVSRIETSTIGEEEPPVAIRSNFPQAPPASPPAPQAAVAEADVGLVAGSLSSLPEPESGLTTASETVIVRNVEEPESLGIQNPNSGPNRAAPKGVKSSERRAPEARSPSSRCTDDERRTIVNHEDGPAVEVEDNEAEPISEVLSTSKRKRKRVFSHTSSVPRMNLKEREGVSPKIDFSKTDLSDPSKLTMREIIRRAEAIERKKVKGDTTTKRSAQNAGQQKQTAIVEAPVVPMAPQVQVIDGRIVINEQSLTIGAYASTRQNTDSYTRVEENASRLNYNSYSNRTPSERWKSEDTDVFYLALKQFGTDFELIQNLFPGRSRRQVKAKFKKEERNNPRRLQDALAHRPKDQLHYTDMINRLKADEPDQISDDPFAAILAHTNDVASGEQTETT